MYYIDDRILDGTEEQLMEQLANVSAQRRENVLRYRFSSGRWQSLRAYQLLQCALHEEYGIDEPPVFSKLENGKPVIVGHEDIHFNMSHCKKGVACAMSLAPVGIDIEEIPEKINLSLAEYVFNETEMDMLHRGVYTDIHGSSSLSPEEIFTKLWTMKEALVKMTGRGLTGKEQLRPLLDDWRRGDAPYHFITIPAVSKGYIVTVCTTDQKLREYPL